jgi:hypothetical protein
MQQLQQQFVVKNRNIALLSLMRNYNQHVLILNSDGSNNILAKLQEQKGIRYVEKVECTYQRFHLQVW